MWLLGSSGFSAQLAGLLGLPFSFAHHFSPPTPSPRWPVYRQPASGPRSGWTKPYAMVAVSVICADTDERAE